MKKVVTIILASILVVGFCFGVLTLIDQRLEAATKRHLVWDHVDEVFYCLGSAINCVVLR